MLFATAALSLAVRLLLVAPVSQVGAIPVASHPNTTSAATSSSSYWLSSIQRQGTAAFGTAGYKVYRSVADYGAKGKS